MRKAILHVSRLTIRRGETHILSDLDWTIREGEHWVILGGNGSGKTSLLRAIGGYFPPTSGEIRLFGEDFGECDWRELRERIGIVSASIAQLIHEEDSALEIVAGGRRAMVGYWGRIPAAERRRARALLDDVEAAHLAGRPWLFLSQGERQRVLIARAMMANPKLLLLDEPCAGLDPVARERFLAFVQRVGSSAKSPPLVLVTHHVEEIMPVFTHALLLKNGSVIASGPAAKTLTSRTFADLLDARVSLQKRRGRYALSLSGGPHSS